MSLNITKKHVKFATNTVAGYGIGRIIGGVAQTIPRTGRIDNFAVLVGTMALAYAVATAVEPYTNAYIDAVDDAIKNYSKSSKK